MSILLAANPTLGRLGCRVVPLRRSPGPVPCCLEPFRRLHPWEIVAKKPSFVADRLRDVAYWLQIVAEKRFERMLDLSNASVKSLGISRIHDETKEDRKTVADHRVRCRNELVRRRNILALCDIEVVCCDNSEFFCDAVTIFCDILGLAGGG
jgi:hypothetical protein